MSLRNPPKAMSAGRPVGYHRPALLLAGTLLLAVIIWKAATLLNWNPRYRVGQEVDRLNGVAVFYNGGVGHSAGRNLAPDGYNLGLKYQCVEFVKRYYYQRLNHKMPESSVGYGRALARRSSQRKPALRPERHAGRHRNPRPG